jgi:FtsP/CotA-like multicopper oxidase with cupredoxin domain
VEPLLPRPADVVHTTSLKGGIKPYAWSMNDEYWPHVTPLMLSAGQRVEIDLINRSMMAHAMHLHGHSFQVIAIDGRQVNGAVRDSSRHAYGPCSNRIRCQQSGGRFTATTSTIWLPR